MRSSFCCLEICSWNSCDGEEVGGWLETRSRRVMACSRVCLDVSSANLRAGSVTMSSISIVVAGLLGHGSQLRKHKVLKIRCRTRLQGGRTERLSQFGCSEKAAPFCEPRTTLGHQTMGAALYFPQRLALNPTINFNGTIPLLPSFSLSTTTFKISLYQFCLYNA